MGDLHRRLPKSPSGITRSTSPIRRLRRNRSASPCTSKAGAQEGPNDETRWRSRQSHRRCRSWPRQRRRAVRGGDADTASIATCMPPPGRSHGCRRWSASESSPAKRAPRGAVAWKIPSKASIVAVFSNWLIPRPDECFAGADQDHDVHLGIVAQFVRAWSQPFPYVERHGVALFGDIVEGDDADTIGDPSEDLAVGMGDLSALLWGRRGSRVIRLRPYQEGDERTETRPHQGRSRLHLRSIHSATPGCSLVVTPSGALPSSIRLTKRRRGDVRDR